MRRGKRRAAAFSAVLSALAGCAREPGGTEPRVAPGLLVAHALGEVGGHVYTNSLEALDCNYARGFRWFEVDLALTADGQLVCFHPGHEQLLGLARPLQDLDLAQLSGKRYGGRYPLRRFDELLTQTERLGDVVLVTDTKTWSSAMLEAFERAVRLAQPKRTRFALQSYGERDIAAVRALSERLHASLFLTLYMSSADDPEVEALVKAHGVDAVVADARRFTPWLAQRLHAVNVPLLVHTINEHRDIARLTRAGADGFYTDGYRPYVPSPEARSSLADCSFPGDPGAELEGWAERDVLRPGDYLLASCAHRGPNRVELSGCGSDTALMGPSLALPPGHEIRLELDVEAGAGGAEAWLELGQKNRSEPLRPRERLQLATGERRALALELPLPAGTPGVEVRLGLGSPSQRLLVHRLWLSQRASAAPALATAAAPPELTREAAHER